MYRLRSRIIGKLPHDRLVTQWLLQIPFCMHSVEALLTPQANRFQIADDPIRALGRDQMHVILRSDMVKQPRN